MRTLEYPFDCEYILKKKKTIKKELLAIEGTEFLKKKIAILGGSTTNDIKLILELFLLNHGIEPEFYESEYNQFWEDAVFDNKELEEFKPDIIFIHTTNKNIINFPYLNDSEEQISDLLEREYNKFEEMWEKLFERYNCPIIQNNFDYPFYRLLGNKDSSDIHGKTNYIIKLNSKFAEYANCRENFFINDINYLSAQIGLEKWFDPFYWYMYKYAISYLAIPEIAFSVANIIKAIFGKNKKSLVLDLDNTLWGGIVGDDGVENLVLGKETPEGQVYLDFQKYIKEHKSMGIILNVSSKNDEKNAIAGLSHSDSVLNVDDFIVFKANWNPKSENIISICEELNIGQDSIVFVDDNPAERAIVNQHVPMVSVPEMISPEKYINVIDRSGFFEVVKLSNDDLKKNEMYKENTKRVEAMQSFLSYEKYLESLDMRAEISSFIPIYMSRIAQLTNKSNQFNLTTKRYTQSEIEVIAKSDNYITLYGKLEDSFGDNGVVSVIIGEVKEDILNIDLWIMSCRVLKRDMEFAMMDSLVKKARKRKIKEIYGYYYPTVKNGMVKDFYHLQGFDKIKEDEDGNSIWKYEIKGIHKNKNKFIKVED